MLRTVDNTGPLAVSAPFWIESSGSNSEYYFKYIAWWSFEYRGIEQKVPSTDDLKFLPQDKKNPA